MRRGFPIYTRGIVLAGVLLTGSFARAAGGTYTNSVHVDENKGVVIVNVQGSPAASYPVPNGVTEETLRAVLDASMLRAHGEWKTDFQSTLQLMAQMSKKELSAFQTQIGQVATKVDAVAAKIDQTGKQIAELRAQAANQTSDIIANLRHERDELSQEIVQLQGQLVDSVASLRERPKETVDLSGVSEMIIVPSALASLSGFTLLVYAAQENGNAHDLLAPSWTAAGVGAGATTVGLALGSAFGPRNEYGRAPPIFVTMALTTVIAGGVEAVVGEGLLIDALIANGGKHQLVHPGWALLGTGVGGVIVGMASSAVGQDRDERKFNQAFGPMLGPGLIGLSYSVSR
jgi:hypothetical protein